MAAETLSGHVLDLFAPQCFLSCGQQVVEFQNLAVAVIKRKISRSRSRNHSPNDRGLENSMNYVTVFDGYAPGINWDFPVSGLFAIALGVLLVMNHKNMTNHWARNTVATAVFAYCFLSFAFIWTLVGIIFAYSNYQALSKPQDVKVVAGIVTNFSPMNSSGHKVESFCVLENCFQYSDYVLTGGFNTTSAHGGPIREGLRVRVSYIGDVIVKLEIAD